jgi:hypothetical protein
MVQMRTTALRDTTAPQSTNLVTRPPHAPPDCSAVFLKIAGDCERAIRGKRVRAIAGDSDAVHTMRIELTRLRAAALFFRVDDHEWEFLNKELGWLNSALGKARNRDVTVEYANRKRYRRWAAQSRRKLTRSLGQSLSPTGQRAPLSPI